ncbi:MAG: transcription antitermination factor NusB [Clostridia bacterium]|nr:transcription antitermination factor NusB [Clostridia bacterium]
MARRKSRELAFLLLFEKCFDETDMQEIIDRAIEARDIEPDEFAVRLALGADEYALENDRLIEEHSHRWSKNRLSKVTLSLLRLALYEMLYVEETPVSVAINEAVELAKTYGADDEPPFINGVLGAVARKRGDSDDTEADA